MRRFLSAAAIVLMALMASCYVPVGGNPASSQDMLKFQKMFMSSYYSNVGGSPSGARALVPFGGTVATTQDDGSRATVPVHNTTVFPSAPSFATLISNPAASNTIANYPETGQSSVFVVTSYDAGNNVYKISVTTNFSASDTRSTYVEEYFVKDVTTSGTFGNFSSGWNLTPSGTWTTDDPIVKNSSGTWVQDQNARIKMLLTFKDGTTRSETIVSGNNSGDSKFSSFDVNGSLNFESNFVPSTTTSGTVDFSSVVVYQTTPSTNPNFWFWQGSTSQSIVGIRYYTEERKNSATELHATSVSFEKTVSTNTGTSGSLSTTLKTITGSSGFDSLAESVLREKTVWPIVSGNPVFSSATVTKYMKTRVVNIATNKDFYLQQLNDDYVSLQSWASGTKYSPSSSVAETVQNDANALIFDRTTLTSGVSGTAPYAVVTSNLGTSNVFSQAYTSITDGVFTSSATTSVPTSNVSSGTVLTFNGQQVTGTSIAYNENYKLGKTGVVEAWVYLNALTDTMGIVHYGTNTDFSDEGYSLQGWGANGQISLIVNHTSGYDQVLSKTLLKTKKWYHILGVWDMSAATPYISLYINGTLDKTNTSVSANLKSQGSKAFADTRTSNQVMVGSQLPNSFSAAYGYFGMNGKVVGVNIKKLNDPLSSNNYAGLNATPTQTVVANAILSAYNANVGNTSGW